jgi:microcystin-dependent protein
MNGGMNGAYIGEIRLFGGAYTPNGWLLCDGRTVPRQSYQQLYDVIGTRYGGDESLFAVPDLTQTANAQHGVAYIIFHGGHK